MLPARYWLALGLSLVAVGCQPPPPKAVRQYCSALSPAPVIDTSLPILTSGFGADSNNQRYTTDSAINSGNVDQLSLRYSLVDTKADIRRGASAATAATLYFTTEHQVYAVDRDSGCIHWQHDVPKSVLRSASVLLFDHQQTRSVVVGTNKAEVIALDANNGSVQWQTSAANTPFADDSMITGGLQYASGKVFVPIASHEVASAVAQLVCCDTHGALRALDAASGQELWAYETTATAVDDPVNLFRRGPNGVSVWSTPLIDPVNQQVLIGTSQNFTPPATPNADAVVALDINSGEEAWIFKATAVDFYNSSCGQDLSPFKHCEDPSFDYDVVTPLRVTDAHGVTRIIAADKGGWVYGLKPGTGELLWKTKVGAGGLLGGIHWGLAADQNRVYATVADFAVPKVTLLAGQAASDLLSISPGPVENAEPGLYALDLATGEVVWQVRDSHLFEGEFYRTVYSAPASVVNDVVLAGSLSGVLKAFNSSTGEELWAFDSVLEVEDIHGNRGQGGTIDSVGPIVAADEILLNSGYSVFNIGGRNAYQAGPGNALMVLALPQSASTPTTP